jgi:hypothetical protein
MQDGASGAYRAGPVQAISARSKMKKIVHNSGNPCAFYTGTVHAQPWLGQGGVLRIDMRALTRPLTLPPDTRPVRIDGWLTEGFREATLNGVVYPQSAVPSWAKEFDHSLLFLDT